MSQNIRLDTLNISLKCGAKILTRTGVVAIKVKIHGGLLETFGEIRRIFTHIFSNPKIIYRANRGKLFMHGILGDTVNRMIHLSHSKHKLEIGGRFYPR